MCTAALAAYLGYPVSPALAEELERVERDAVFERRIFMIRSLGFVTPTAARRITQEEAMRFETVHEQTYRARGFEIVPVVAGSVLDRVAAIRKAL